MQIVNPYWFNVINNNMKLKKLLEKNITTDCSQKTGITVGLLDGLIAQIRIIRDRNLKPDEIIEVFKDLADDEDFEWLYQEVKKQK